MSETLRTGLAAYWSFEGTTPPYFQPDLATGRFTLTSERAGLGPGKVGQAYIGSAGHGFTSSCSTTDLMPGPQGLTVCFWFRLDTIGGTPVARYIIRRHNFTLARGWYIHQTLNKQTALMRVGVKSGKVEVYTEEIPGFELGKWFFARYEFNLQASLIKAFINEQLIRQRPLNAVATEGDDYVRVGMRPTDQAYSPFPGGIDELGVWQRCLTATEAAFLYNGGAGVPFSAFPDPTAVACDRGQVCCDTSDDAAAGGVQAGEPYQPVISEPCVEPIVTFMPPTGSKVSFPTHAAIYSSDPTAPIYYTTDGSDPRENGRPYTGPVAVSGPDVVLRAYANKVGCPSAVATAVYEREVEFGVFWRFICPDSADRAGRWNQFAPNGKRDHRWRLDLSIPDGVTVNVQKILILETDGDGFWNTGQAWATQQINDTRPMGPKDFNTFPVVLVRETDGVQVNDKYSTAFSADFGTWDKDTGDFILFGEIERTLTGGYFLCMLYLSDGRVIRQLIPSEPCDPPPPCEEWPDPPDIADVGCTQILLEWTPTSNRFELIRRYMGESTVLTEDGELGEYLDTGLGPGEMYCYYIRSIVPPCEQWTSSQTVCARTLLPPTVNVTVDKTTVGVGETFVFRISSTNIAIGGECLTDRVIIKCGNETVGDVPGNASDVEWAGQQFQPGMYEYSFTGCSACDTVTVRIVIEVAGDPECNPCKMPEVVAIQDVDAVMDALRDSFQISGNIGESCYYTNMTDTGIPWDGVLHRVIDKVFCGYLVDQPPPPYNTWKLFTFVKYWGYPDDPYIYHIISPEGYTQLWLDYSTEHGKNIWKLVISVYSSVHESVMLWIGYRTTGLPQGTYYRVSGCCTGPDTITVTVPS